MLQELFTSAEFYDPKSRGNQLKSPVRLLAGACRDLRVQGEATPGLAQLTVPLGQELFNPPTVKGWPVGSDWISASTLVLRGWEKRWSEVRSRQPPHHLAGSAWCPCRDPRQAAATTRRQLQMDAERAAQLAEKRLAVRFDPHRLVAAATSADPEALADQLVARLLVVKPRAVTRQAVIEACRKVPADQRTALAVTLLLASPEYQLE